MPAITMTHLLSGNPDSPSRNGAVRVFTGTFPASNATGTCAIGYLDNQMSVEVLPTQAVTGYTIPLIEILASITTGAQGVVTVGTQDGSSSPASTATFMLVVKRN